GHRALSEHKTLSVSWSHYLLSMFSGAFRHFIHSLLPLAVASLPRRAGLPLRIEDAIIGESEVS
ncbi:hypothetical protein, partial [Escherichia coli]|uniref:hypothetical protein n=1 Tax=Escherichia coli TaxID=562 RepID=UPI001BC86103